jgi:hypothetical protein
MVVGSRWWADGVRQQMVGRWWWTWRWTVGRRSAMKWTGGGQGGGLSRACAVRCCGAGPAGLAGFPRSAGQFCQVARGVLDRDVAAQVARPAQRQPDARRAGCAGWRAIPRLLGLARDPATAGLLLISLSAVGWLACCSPRGRGWPAAHPEIRRIAPRRCRPLFPHRLWLLPWPLDGQGHRRHGRVLQLQVDGGPRRRSNLPTPAPSSLPPSPWSQTTIKPHHPWLHRPPRSPVLPPDPLMAGVH